MIRKWIVGLIKEALSDSIEEKFEYRDEEIRHMVQVVGALDKHYDCMSNVYRTISSQSDDLAAIRRMVCLSDKWGTSYVDRVEHKEFQGLLDKSLDKAQEKLDRVKRHKKT